MTRQRIGYGLGLVALALALATTQAAVTVQMVEGDFGAANLYAPVNFAGASSVTAGGVTYVAQGAVGSGSASTYSAHASLVRDALIGAGRPANGVTTTIYAQQAINYLNSLNLYSGLGVGLRPATLGNGIKVTNHTYAINLVPYTVSNEDTRRRIDYQIAREDLVFVAGAVSTGTPGTPITWSSLNAIAVAGWQGFTPDTTGLTRKHADLWANSNPISNPSTPFESSYATPTVSSYAVGLLNRGTQLSYGAQSQRHEVVKSLLMTGANKNLAGIQVSSWTNNATSNNNLNTKLGAGQADYDRSKLILEAGEKITSAITGGTSLGSTPTINSNLGWTYETLSGNTSEALVFALNSAIDDFAATLNWDTTVTEPTGITIDTNSQIFANLDLELRQVFFNSGSYSLGGSLGGTLVSASVMANTEHLYYKGTLGPGLYALVVKSNPGDPANTNYGLSYIAVPEPGTLGLLGLGSAGLLLKRRRQGGKS